MVARLVFKPQRAMWLGHSTSPVPLTHVNLSCKDANKFFLSKKHMHRGSSMHARRPELDTGTLQHTATAVVLVIVRNWTKHPITTSPCIMQLIKLITKLPNYLIT